MRKKSHISLAKFLVEHVDADEMQNHKKAFYLGSILPDCKPSFLTERHEFYGTFDKVSEQIRELAKAGEEMAQDSMMFWRHLGEIIHYIADYFTFPHNRLYMGTIREHCAYEKEMRDYLKEYISSGGADRLKIKERAFDSVDALLDFIRRTHEEYTKRLHTIDDDVRCIVRICQQVITAVVQLACSSAPGFAHAAVA